MKKDFIQQNKSFFFGMDTQGFDPEMLFVECGKCGHPIVWEQGRATEILHSAGIDALELDHHCLLITDGCPRCTKGKVYHVQIYRVETEQDRWGQGKKSGNA